MPDPAQRATLRLPSNYLVALIFPSSAATRGAWPEPFARGRQSPEGQDLSSEQGTALLIMRRTP